MCGRDALFVAKNGISGVYTDDPNRSSTAKQYMSLHYNDVLRHDLKVMDQSALLLARDNHLPVHVFDFDEADAMNRICSGETISTLIYDGLTAFAE